MASNTNVFFSPKEVTRSVLKRKEIFAHTPSPPFFLTFETIVSIIRNECENGNSSVNVVLPIKDGIENASISSLTAGLENFLLFKNVVDVTATCEKLSVTNQAHGLPRTCVAEFSLKW